MTGTWTLDPAPFQEPGYILRFRLANGHTLVFPLTSDHPIVLGMKSAARMDKEVPAE